MTKTNFPFLHKLGVKAKSNISGFKGLITARAQYLHGCNRYWISPQELTKDKDLNDGYWFDEDELIIEKPKIVRKKTNADRGGPPSKIK